MNPWNIEPAAPAELTQEQWQAIHALAVRLRWESLPDDPPPTLEEVIQSWSAHPPVIEERAWVAWDSAAPADTPRAIGYNRSTIFHMEENAHLVQVYIGVNPADRRRGLGKKLLARSAAFAQESGRRMLMIESNSNCPAGGKFLKAVGAEQGLSLDVVQLDLTQVDRNLLRSWILRAEERAQGFEVGFWEGACPEEALEQVCLVREAMNEQPTQDLDVEDFKWTPEILRQVDDNLAQRHITRWTFYSREIATGDLTGFTEVLWMPGNPMVGQQGDTGVLKAYQNKGIGRWLKAAMLEKILEEKPETRFIRTGNATTNAPMQKINQELGFKLFRSAWIWQLSTEKALEYTAL
jgi:GNAT superfamily N-acetyltransferase